MNKKVLTKFYPDFSPEERATLVIKALARDDAEEIKQLFSSAPRYMYTVTDLEFRMKLRDMFWFAGLFGQLVLRNLLSWQFYLHYSWRSEARNPEERCPELTIDEVRSFHDGLDFTRALIAGFDRFCLQELGVTGNELLKVAAPVAHEEIEDFQFVLRLEDTNKPKVEEAFTLILNAWSGHAP